MPTIQSLFRVHLDALALHDEARALTRGEIGIALALHLAGLGAVCRYFNLPLWSALLVLAVFLVLPALLIGRTHRSLSVETLAPLFFLYAVLFARVLAMWIFHTPYPYQDESTLANVRVLVLQIEPAAIAALAYTFIIQVARLAHVRGLLALLLVLGIASLAWFGGETWMHRTRGVTATDPYAYTQMAVDLATRGTLLHAFPLFDAIKDTGIKWYPIEHLGYRLFGDLTGNVATVWPPGGAIALAIAYRIFGETGLYLATPLAALAALLATAWLAWEYAHNQARLARAAIVTLTVALLATSWEQVDRSLVPLVDVQAQFFSVVAIALTLRAMRSNRFILFGVLAGLALGAAYFVRHTQVLLVIPIVFAAWHMPRRNRVRFLLATASAALIVALPDLVYHQQNFGSWLTPESNELALFSLAGITPSAQVIADRFFAGNEFGYLVPFFVYGIYRAGRTDAKKLAVLAAWLIGLVAFHLFYPALRMRDLLPEFPAVALLIAYGIVTAIRDLRASQLAILRLASAPSFFLALLLMLTRTQFTLQRIVQPARVTFGYVTAAQRASFDQIAALTPRDAVIGSVMNDGALDLYAQRATFRPGAWSADELAQFVALMQNAGRRVYVLDDGAETSAARRDLASRYAVQPIAVFDVPLFSVVDGTAGMLYEIKN